jgi:hypothetical protein
MGLYHTVEIRELPRSINFQLCERILNRHDERGGDTIWSFALLNLPGIED